MTPKEKAEELMNKYKDLSIVTTYNGNDYNIVAKRCALILVDEIIKAIDNSVMDYQKCVEKIKYWVEVKKELINFKQKEK